MNHSPEQARRLAAIRTPGQLESSLLSFDLPGEIERLRQEDAWQGGRNAKTLVKHCDFRMVLTVLKSGARLHEHRVAGSISVHTVAGHIRMHTENQVYDLPAGHVLALEREIAHDVEALEDSAFLLTIAWPESASNS